LSVAVENQPRSNLQLATAASEERQLSVAGSQLSVENQPTGNLQKAVGFWRLLCSLLGIFAWMQKDKKREGQAGSPGTASQAKQGRAPGLD
jgi:hypothetical protein